MAFLKLNGVTIPVFADSLREVPIAIGDLFGRAVSGRHYGTMTATKRRWTFETNQMARADAEKMRKWIEGAFQTFALNADALSGTGVALSGSLTHTASGGKHTGYTTVASGTHAIANMANKLYLPAGWSPTVQGWTHAAFSYRTIAADGVPADGWYDYLASGLVAVTQGASANPAGVTQYRDGVAGSHSWGNFNNVLTTGNLVGFSGKTTANVSAAKNYDEFLFAPFEIPSSWVAGLTAFRAAYALAPAPNLYATGDWFDEVAPIEVICRVEAVRQLTAVLPGQSLSSAVRQFSVVMEEV
jgi:hypothetical protein